LESVHRRRRRRRCHLGRRHPKDPQEQKTKAKSVKYSETDDLRLRTLDLGAFDLLFFGDRCSGSAPSFSSTSRGRFEEPALLIKINNNKRNKLKDLQSLDQMIPLDLQRLPLGFRVFSSI
jgi:hypothetical protein